jgi:NNP family nitrate/nitrite transporter-like MFS transporter
MGMGGTAISALTTVRLVNAHGTATPFIITACVLAAFARRPRTLAADYPAAKMAFLFPLVVNIELVGHCMLSRVPEPSALVARM